MEAVMRIFLNVVNTDLEKYKNRLLAIDFKDKENILDAGFGMGNGPFIWQILIKMCQDWNTLRIG